MRAAADLVSDEIVVIGSQAAVGQSDGLPETMTVSMEWLPPTDEFPTPDGGGFGFREPAWAVTIQGPVRGIPGEPTPGMLNVIMVDDASARVWGWTP